MITRCTSLLIRERPVRPVRPTAILAGRRGCPRCRNLADNSVDVSKKFGVGGNRKRPPPTARGRPKSPKRCHCEERSDGAISHFESDSKESDCFAALAMT